MTQPATQFVPSQRTAYQFPVYRWIGWLAVGGFAIGLTVMFFIAGLFGIPAPLGWAAIVILFTLGAMLLDRPKLLLTLMLFYFLLMPSNRLLGLVGLPLPLFIDELFFLPFIAVIVMNWIQRRQLAEATFFPLAFILTAAVSWYINRPSLFTAVQVTLIMLKSYIIWYFCRLTCTFDNEQQLGSWVGAYVGYVAVQLFYNILWQRAPWPRFHPDRSGGVFGPDSAGSAHIVGYLSAFGLFLLAGWWVSRAHQSSLRRRWLVILTAILISYNFIFMTDTKHGLIFFPVAFLPFLFHPRFPARLRLGLISAGMVFLIAAWAYFQMTVRGGVQLQRYLQTMVDSPKGDMFYAVTTDFPYLTSYPLLGAGPGRFASVQAVDARAPLARRYIIPHVDQRRRLAYFSSALAGTTASASILGNPQSDFFVLMGEYGWLGAAIYYWFIFWVIFRLWKKSIRLPLDSFASGVYMALACCLIFFVFTTTIMMTATIGVLAFPIWMLVGRVWDMKTGAEEAPSG